MKQNELINLIQYNQFEPLLLQKISSEVKEALKQNSHERYQENEEVIINSIFVSEKEILQERIKLLTSQGFNSSIVDLIQPMKNQITFLDRFIYKLWGEKDLAKQSLKKFEEEKNFIKFCDHQKWRKYVKVSTLTDYYKHHYL